MKRLLFLFLLTLSFANCFADGEFVNLTPRPKACFSHEGTCYIPKTFTVGVAETLGDTVMTEAQRFVDGLNATMTGYTVTLAHTTENAFIKVGVHTGKTALGNEGYRINIKVDSVNVYSITQKGFYYAFQSIKKMLPANVAIGVKADEYTVDTLPVANITDVPRFGYRGFMLDVSRHFFTVQEVKKIIDLMAIYKMNVFHWHLTDDQGWRAEIKKYPKLTTIGATRSNSWNTDIHLVDNYWWTGEGAYTGQTYGPYYYTQDEMREVVEYAAERHIDVLPEVDMPGHFVAAMAAYPEYCCHPSSAPTVWTSGGVSSDVLNVGNADAVQFAKDILSELCDIFPYPYFHIGGDECPTTQWESNTECKAKYTELGLTSYRALQTHFIKDISDYLKTKGKNIVCWNEAVTASGADLDLMKESGATIMCWNPCQSGAQKAVQLGLDAIITEYHSSTGGYYINRRQSNDYGEPTGAGAGDDTVEGCYEYVPVQGSYTTEQLTHIKGVQGTFWCEHVSSNEYLEYLALPRLICVAEAGWSQQDDKDWTDFKLRLTRDTEMLDLGGYIYAKHWMDGYIHRTYVNPIKDNAIVTFTNDSSDRGRCLCDADGTLNGQGAECTQWILESAGTDGEYYIKSKESGKYLYVSATSSGTMVTLSTNKTIWTFDVTTVSGYVAICPKANTSVAINNNSTNTTKARLFAHASGNTSSFWKVDSYGTVDCLQAINTLPSDAGPIYNLQGRRLDHPTKGINIIGNKKVMY